MRINEYIICQLSYLIEKYNKHPSSMYVLKLEKVGHILYYTADSKTSFRGINNVISDCEGDIISLSNHLVTLLDYVRLSDRTT